MAPSPRRRRTSLLLPFACAPLAAFAAGIAAHALEAGILTFALTTPATILAFAATRSIALSLDPAAPPFLPRLELRRRDVTILLTAIVIGLAIMAAGQIIAGSIATLTIVGAWVAVALTRAAHHGGLRV